MRRLLLWSTVVPRGVSNLPKTCLLPRLIHSNRATNIKNTSSKETFLSALNPKKLKHASQKAKEISELLEIDNKKNLVPSEFFELQQQVRQHLELTQQDKEKNFRIEKEDEIKISHLERKAYEYNEMMRQDWEDKEAELKQELLLLEKEIELQRYTTSKDLQTEGTSTLDLQLETRFVKQEIWVKVSELLKDTIRLHFERGTLDSIQPVLDKLIDVEVNKLGKSYNNLDFCKHIRINMVATLQFYKKEYAEAFETVRQVIEVQRQAIISDVPLKNLFIKDCYKILQFLNFYRQNCNTKYLDDIMLVKHEPIPFIQREYRLLHEIYFGGTKAVFYRQNLFEMVCEDFESATDKPKPTKKSKKSATLQREISLPRRRFNVIEKIIFGKMRKTEQLYRDLNQPGAMLTDTVKKGLLDLKRLKYLCYSKLAHLITNVAEDTLSGDTDALSAAAYYITEAHLHFIDYMESQLVNVENLNEQRLKAVYADLLADTCIIYNIGIEYITMIPFPYSIEQVNQFIFKYSQKSIEIFNSLYPGEKLLEQPKYALQVAKTLVTLARLFERMGDLEKALAIIDASNAYFRKLFGFTSYAYVRGLYVKALMLAKKGDVEKAKEIFQTVEADNSYMFPPKNDRMNLECIRHLYRKDLNDEHILSEISSYFDTNLLENPKEPHIAHFQIFPINYLDESLNCLDNPFSVHCYFKGLLFSTIGQNGKAVRYMKMCQRSLEIQHGKDFSVFHTYAILGISNLTQIYQTGSLENRVQLLSHLKRSLNEQNMYSVSYPPEVKSKKTVSKHSFAAMAAMEDPENDLRQLYHPLYDSLSLTVETMRETLKEQEEELQLNAHLAAKRETISKQLENSTLSSEKRDKLKQEKRNASIALFKKKELEDSTGLRMDNIEDNFQGDLLDFVIKKSEKMEEWKSMKFSKEMLQRMRENVKNYENLSDEEIVAKTKQFIADQNYPTLHLLHEIPDEEEQREMAKLVYFEDFDRFYSSEYVLSMLRKNKIEKFENDDFL